jgi:PAS domain S-box-containing protein
MNPATGGLAAALRRHGLAAAVLAAGFALTAMATYWQVRGDFQRSSARFQEDVSHLADALDARLHTYAAVLGAGAGLFDASQQVGIDEWRAFVSAVGLERNYPGMMAIGHSEKVPDAMSTADYESRVGAARGAAFRLYQGEARRDRHAVVYLEPENSRTRSAIGYDMHSEPVRRAAMEAAAASGLMRMSAAVMLLPPQGESRGVPGLLMFQPLFWRERPVATPQERAAALRGYVYAPFRVDEVMRAVFGTDSPEFDFSLHDLGGPTAENTELWRHAANAGAPQAADLASSRAIAVGGRIIALKATADPRYGDPTGLRQELVVAGAGALTTILLALIVATLARTRERALRLAADMTRDLEATRRRFERMVAGTTDGLWEFDTLKRKSYLSPRFMELLGFPAQEAIEGAGWMPARLHPEDRAGVVAGFESMLRGGGFDGRMRIRMRDDTYRWFRVRGRAFDEGGSRSVAGSMGDVDDEQQAQLREARLLKVIEMSPDIFMTFDLEGRATYLNAAGRRIFGELGSGNLAGLSIMGMFAQNEVDRVFNEGLPTAYMQDFWEGETELITAEGEVLPVSQSILAHKGASGQVEFYSTVMRDISERRASMKALMEAQERLQRALDGSSDVIWERNIASDTFYASERLNEILGYADDTDFSTRAAWEGLIHPDDLPGHKAAAHRMHNTREPVVWDSRHRCADGSWRWLRRRGRAVFDADGRALLTAGTMTDIHDAKLAEAALQDLQARYQRALDGSNDGIWERVVATDAFFTSDRLKQILGYGAEAMPVSREGWRELIHPDDRPVSDRAVAAMVAGTDTVVWDTRMRTGSGEYRWMRRRGRVVRDAAGRAVLTAGTLTDIHEAKLAEEELKLHRDHLARLVEERTAGLEQARREADAQREVAEAERQGAEVSREAAVRANLAKSEFLANMSHELRTPMHAIMSFADFGVEKSERAERAKLSHYFGNIRKSGARLLSLLNDLLDLSKLEAGKMDMHLTPGAVDGLLGDVAVESEAFAQARGVALVVEGAAAIAVEWDMARMMQVLRNLVSNAVKFSLAGGTVRLTAAPRALRAGRRQDDPLVDGIEIRVTDAGIGIPDDELETVFDKFVQSSKTKTGAGGTGLGLAICREIVQAHGGTIRAINNPAPATGATFIVHLPAAPALLQAARAGAADIPALAGEETA